MMNVGDQNFEAGLPRAGCTGFASPTQDFQENPLDLNQLLVAHPQATFFMRASGRAMPQSGIHPGDILIVDRALSVRSDDVVVAVFQGEMIVRRFSRRGGGVWLLPESDQDPPLAMTDDPAGRIWGVVTYVLHGLRGADHA